MNFQAYNMLALPVIGSSEIWVEKHKSNNCKGRHMVLGSRENPATHSWGNFSLRLRRISINGSQN